jgi:TolB-like protein
VSLLRELQRRNVIRVAGLYLVSAWLLVQVASVLLPTFEAPAWVMKSFVALLAIGFLPALAFSWAFELTPDGLKREGQIDRSQSITDQTARKLDVAVIALLLCVAGLLLWTRLRPHAVEAAPAAPAAAAAQDAKATEAITDKSIAVLPFADFSKGGDQGWFADGLTEEILNALARTPDLAVSARTSSFKYKASTLAVPQIARELGVAYVLEGSVRGDASRVRVTAQLIRAADGFHLWSQNFDRDASDIISIQEELAREIATVMQTSMDPKALADMAQVGTKSVEAYQEYLRGVAEQSNPQQAAFERALKHFERARELDPTFAAAHARAAGFWLARLDPTLTYSGRSDLRPETMRQNFNERIDQAIQYATSDFDRHVARGLKARLDMRLRDAIEEQRKILALRPQDRDALASLVELYSATSQNALMAKPLALVLPHAFEGTDWAMIYLNYGHRAPDVSLAADNALKLAARWPDDSQVVYQAHRTLLWDRRVDAARGLAERYRAMATEPLLAMIVAARQAAAEGRCAEVERLLATLPASDNVERWHLLMLLGRREEATQALMPLERSGNTQALVGFLNYRQFDATPFPSLMRVLEREKVDRPPAVALPFACMKA